LDVCGIVGYIGDQPALPVLLAGLRRLEYRGYDSAGVAVRHDGRFLLEKRTGRVDALAEALQAQPAPDGTSGIGHTRWATHGRPTDANAHPHADEGRGVVVVHNGIIENHQELREELAARGHRFASETDSEVVAHLVEEAYRDDLAAAVRAAVARLRGSFALAVLCRAEPDRLVGARQQAPLVVGLGEGENFLASDIAALLPYTRRVLILEDGEIADVRRGGAAVTGFDGAPRERAPLTVGWDPGAAERGGFPHFMLKEIHEQPQALRETLRGRLGPEGATLRAELAAGGADVPERLAAAGRIWLVACGTAYHACLVGRRLIEAWSGCPAEADLASEFRYRDPLVAEGDAVVAVSQSGETADTLAALREGRRRGALGVAVSNVVGASIPRAADATLHTWAGPEIAVASTKAYTTQILALTLLALHLGEARGRLPAPERARLAEEVAGLPELVAEALAAVEEPVRALAARLAAHDHAFFIGRGLDWAVAMEGQLKLKEISYLHAEAYAAGELKHGTLALVTDGVPVVALVTQPDLAEKAASNVAEVRARGARVVAVTTPSLLPAVEHLADDRIVLPEVAPWLAPAVAAVPLQLLAYHTAVARGTDVDKPRNLAKSVTVE
jgi:glucosamine--fructose-6-phosphate aminotransferase (isomerizing)